MKKDYKKYKILLKGAKIKLLATDNAIIVEGNKLEILALLSTLMKRLVDNGAANVEDLAFCLKYALNEKDLEKEVSENLEKSKDGLKEILRKN